MTDGYHGAIELSGAIGFSRPPVVREQRHIGGAHRDRDIQFGDAAIVAKMDRIDPRQRASEERPCTEPEGPDALREVDDRPTASCGGAELRPMHEESLQGLGEIARPQIASADADDQVEVVDRGQSLPELRRISALRRTRVDHAHAIEIECLGVERNHSDLGIVAERLTQELEALGDEEPIAGIGRAVSVKKEDLHALATFL
ncbi:hypothetical protein MN032_00100 [Agromyces atrinae]|nr:hypothetical protein [Agromyces atrinae]MCI2956080.1 hypothetical protein [Agromyces atrinae]